MWEIKCPKCGEEFQMEEAGYAAIVKQVRDAEFAKEVKQHEEFLIKEKEAAVQIAKSEVEKKLTAKIADKDAAIAELNAQIKAGADAQKLAVNEAVMKKESELKETLSEKDAEIIKLNAKLDTEVQAIKEQYELQLKLKDEQVEQYKDFKIKLSNKMVGEELEQHCENEFNKYRALGFRNAYFGKDNDDSDGTKGDYIYRETDGDLEFISIMFEMKNERLDSVNKSKNEAFFKKLDEDRKKKNCEYAVLVSMLEPDSELYNSGIVDVSHIYPKMYVIRPQFFIPMITLLRNAALNALEYKKELAEIRGQSIDITNFESKLMDFKDKFAKNYKSASDHFEKAITQIDTSIAALEKVKQELLESVKMLGKANDKADALTIRKLTNKNPTMQAMFKALGGSATTKQQDDQEGEE